MNFLKVLQWISLILLGTFLGILALLGSLVWIFDIHDY